MFVKVVFLDLNKTACEETQKMFDTDYPGQAKFVLCDVTLHDQLEGWYPVLLPNPCDTCIQWGSGLVEFFTNLPHSFNLQITQLVTTL